MVRYLDRFCEDFCPHPYMVDPDGGNICIYNPNWRNDVSYNQGCAINTFFDNSGTCSACPTNCARCESSTGSCLTCVANFILNPDTRLCE